MSIHNQPIIFDLKFTPYDVPKKVTGEKAINKFRETRAYYDMTAGYNVYNYVTTKSKVIGRFTNLEYLEKSMGVFNQNGLISKSELKAMKERASQNRGHIWHGFISLNEHDSPKIDSAEKCIRLVKNVFPTFLAESGLNPKNIDLMCALHLDKPHHLHLHFVFWEKEPTYKRNGTVGYRKRGQMEEKAIDNMFVRLGLFVAEDKDELHQRRNEALKSLRGMTAVKKAMYSNDEIREAILSLSRDLPKEGRLSYGSKDMAEYKGRVDKIVDMLLDYDRVARKADIRFYEALEKRRLTIKNICGKDFVLTEGKFPDGFGKDLPKYHHEINEDNINIIEKIEEDYKRRQGNLVISLCKFIKPEYFTRDPNKRYKVNDKRLKLRLAISKRKIGRRLDKFFATFGKECELLERDFSHRLQDIEKEIEAEKKNAETQKNEKEENSKD